MPISKDKTRMIITLDKTDKEKLETQAKRENRSLNNLVVTILIDYLESL